MNAHRLIELSPIADGFTRVITHATMNRRKRIIFHNFPPGLFVFSFFRLVQPALNIFAGRAPLIARWKMVDIDRTHCPPTARMIGQTGRRVQGDGKGFLLHLTPLRTVVDTDEYSDPPWLESRQGLAHPGDGRDA